MAYTPPKIIDLGDLSKGAHVVTFVNGDRCRFKTGKRLGIDNLNPNKAATLKERVMLLKELEYQVTKALKEGWEPPKETAERPTTTDDAIKYAVREKELEGLATGYMVQLRSTAEKFLDYLTASERKGDINKIDQVRVNGFLKQFISSNTYYMSRRRQLGVLLSLLHKAGMLRQNPVKNTKTRKAVSKLHVPYEASQLGPLFDYLKVHEPKLQLACLITYACLLRPHREVRLLKRSHFTEDLKGIRLSGAENKSKRVRSVEVPSYLQDELRMLKVDELGPEDNIFTRRIKPFNQSYFSRIWGRIAKDLKAKKLITTDQTIYSFRHTAAIFIYRQHRDLSVLQQALGHSSMVVTMTYLRGLGVSTSEALTGAAPPKPGLSEVH